MSIQFDQVDGVVQKDADTAAPPAGAATTTNPPQPPTAEQLEETHRRMAWLTHRLTAD